MTQKLKTKVCKKCRKRQPIENFPKDNSSKDKHWRLCRKCEKIRKSEYYQKKKKQLAASAKPKRGGKNKPKNKK